MSLAEILSVGKAINKNQKNDVEIAAALLWRTANLVGDSIGALFDKKIKYPELKRAFPLFDEEQEERPRWMVIRDSMNSRAAEINRTKGGGVHVRDRV